MHIKSDDVPLHAIFVRVRAGFRAAVDPQSGMSTNLMTVDQWLERDLPSGVFGAIEDYVEAAWIALLATGRLFEVEIEADGIIFARTAAGLQVASRVPLTPVIGGVPRHLILWFSEGDMMTADFPGSAADLASYIGLLREEFPVGRLQDPLNQEEFSWG